MCRALVLVVLAAAPAWAEPQLLPTAELEAKLAALEDQRDAIAAQRERSWDLKISAGVGYGLAICALAVLVGELVAAGARRARPLGGQPGPEPLSLPLLVTTGAVFLGAGVTLHALSFWLGRQADQREDALETEERPLRRQLEAGRDVVPE